MSGEKESDVFYFSYHHIRYGLTQEKFGREARSSCSVAYNHSYDPHRNNFTSVHEETSFAIPYTISLVPRTPTLFLFLTASGVPLV